MPNFRSGYTSLALVIASLSTQAQADDGITRSVSVGPLLVGGEFQGCQLVFDGIRSDPEYSGGETVLIAGSLIIRTTGAAPLMASLRLAAIPVSAELVTPDRPKEAFLIFENGTNATDFVTAIDSDKPGARMFIFKFGKVTADVINNPSGRIRVGYAMKAGGISAPFDIDIRVKMLNSNDLARTERDDSAPKRWLECIQQLQGKP